MVLKSFSSSMLPAINYVLKWEGGLSEPNESDPGGLTNYGIAYRYLREYANKFTFFANLNDEQLADALRNMTLEQAIEVYAKQYWENVSLLETICNQDICNYIFDCVVNPGPGMAIKLLQRALWACGCDRAKVADDGILGPVTVTETNYHYQTIMPALRAERANYYRMRAALNPISKTNLTGWLNRSYGS